MRQLPDPLSSALPRPALQETSADYRKALSCFATGVTVITTHWQGSDWGMTCNSFSSVSLEPRLVLWSIRQAATSLEQLTTSGHFSVSVLSSEQEGLARQFSKGDMASRFAEVEVERQTNQCLRLRHAVSWFDCVTHQLVPAGDHVVVLGRVTDFGWREAPVLGFCRSAFGRFESASIAQAESYQIIA